VSRTGRIDDLDKLRKPEGRSKSLAPERPPRVAPTTIDQIALIGSLTSRKNEGYKADEDVAQIEAVVEEAVKPIQAAFRSPKTPGLRFPFMGEER